MRCLLVSIIVINKTFVIKITPHLLVTPQEKHLFNIHILAMEQMSINAYICLKLLDQGLKSGFGIPSHIKKNANNYSNNNK